MKKVIRIAAMVALLFATSTGFANDGKLNVSSNKENKSLVFEMDDNSGVTKVRLLDSENRVIYSEKVTYTSYAKRFDLRALEEGLYYFQTDNDLKDVTYTVRISGDEVTILEKKEDAKPTFRKVNGVVYMNFLNLEKKDVKISVYDSNNRLVFSEKRINEMNIEKAFNFSKAFEDSYTVIVKSDHNTYYEDVVIN